MANNFGTIVQSTVRPPSTADEFPVFLSKEGKGGYITFDTIEQRNAHPTPRLELYMKCYVQETDVEYRLINLNPVTWEVVDAGGGTASAVAWTNVTGKPIAFTPSPHSHSMSDITGLSGALDEKLDADEKGIPNGIAELGADGKILPSQLPGGLNSVIESYVVGSTPFASDWLSDTEGGSALTPVGSTIYSVMTAGTYQYKTYMWGGSSFIEVSPSLVLGETSNTAYRGDRGKTAYDHSQAAHAPANAQKNSDITKAEIEAKLTGEINTHTHPATEDPYSNADYPYLTTQNLALDFLLYTPITANYTATRYYDIGLSVATLDVDVTLNKDATKLTTFNIDTNPGGTPSLVNLKALMSGMRVDTDVVINPARTGQTTFHMNIVTPFETIVKDINILFYHRKYYGYYGTAGNNLPSIGALEAGSWAWASSKSLSLTAANTANPNGRVFWYCYPDSLGAATFTVNGFGTALPYMLLDMVTPGGATVTMRCYYTTEVKNVAFTFTAS